MNIAIFGSCVSRDTAEFVNESNVNVYVARQSVVSLDAPHGTADSIVQGLNSEFQRRMVEGDLNGDGLERLLGCATGIDALLIDLVDERRGFWMWPDGSSMTNSIEVEACGAARNAQNSGAELVNFGTDLHFRRWLVGFNRLIVGLHQSGLIARTIFLDLEWARALEGNSHPFSAATSKFSRAFRRTQRGFRDIRNSGSNYPTVKSRIEAVFTQQPTEAENFNLRATVANKSFTRYRQIVSAAVPHSISRKSSELRIGKNHKWGPQPFHYRDRDYISVAARIEGIVGDL
ncbi:MULTISPECIES: DUF6270 domain-containing protein [unclassified Brevibacterium]|uniref:DUF6270 domain-containing protein n=1 Tax=unclassified Brevibacterium TaxID=2614124 RepID=UPI002016C553|nr:DUF6270 domain-containing protein [Brevibacterium sp. 2SA]